MAIVRQSVLIAIVAARKIVARRIWPVCTALWFLCAASVAFNTTAHAVTEHTPYPEGAPGDHDTVSVCGEGSYLVGFRVRSGRWFDKIGIICDRRDPSGSDYGDTSLHPMLAERWRRTCRIPMQCWRVHNWALRLEDRSGPRGAAGYRALQRGNGHPRVVDWRQGGFLRS